MKKRRSSSTSGEETKYFDRIPVDLFISNIFSRLQLKSIAQCRCVSKLWSSLIRRPNYNLLFPIKSPAPPRILFTIEYAGELFIYSSPQSHHPDENSSLVATLHHRIPGSKFTIYRPPVGGLVCRQHHRKKHSAVAVISNPMTGEFLALPKLRMDEIKSECSNVNETYSFGYDPIDKQFKVLRISLCDTQTFKFSQYHVLTLGTENQNLLWRNIQSCKLHYRHGERDDNTICINGVLYYPAGFWKGTISCITIACFDVRSEKFSFTTIDQDMEAMMKKSVSYSLIDYKGKLGACYYNINNYRLKLWVLEDAKKHEWSKLIYQIPYFPCSNLRPAGMISSCEIVLHPNYSRNPFYFLYYNLESNISTRVDLQVPKMFGGCRVHVFPNYVEDLELIEMKQRRRKEEALEKRILVTSFVCIVESRKETK